MIEDWQNFLLELGCLALLGVLYYFYQRRKILQYEENKVPYIMNSILQSLLAVRGEQGDSDIDSVIEALDDYLLGRSATPPRALLQKFVHSKSCSPELKDIIDQGLEELDQ